jgi:hypothetical protein
MNFIFAILFSVVGFIASSQTTVHGYCKYFESEDSSAILNRYFSTETFNEQGENIYKKIFPLGNPDSEYKVDYNIGNSSNHIHESIIGTDTARYYTIHDTINSRSYFITGDDTTFIYRTKFAKNNMIESVCLFGCDYREIIGHNQFGSEDTVLTIWANGDTSFAITVYDNQNRQILDKRFLSSPDEVTSMQIKTVYNDSLHTKTVYYGGYDLPDWEDNSQTEITHYNKSKIPVKKELIFTNDGKKEYYLIEYQTE